MATAEMDATAEGEEVGDDANFATKISAPREGNVIDRARALEATIVRQWEDSENEAPTDPYSVLGLDREDSFEAIKERFDARMESYKPSAEDASAGAKQNGAWSVMSIRASRAYELLSDHAKRQSYDEVRKANIVKRSWAKLRFGNGLYEGYVDAQSLFGETPAPVLTGKGVMTLATGEKHEGDYVDGQKHGTGLHLWQSGDIYVGHWENDKMAGQGCYYYTNGGAYFGDFVDGMRHGMGYFRWPCGSIYGGEFASGERCGHGTLEILPGLEGITSYGHYEGEWLRNEISGRGMLIVKDEGVYDGEFQESRFHGEGKMQLANGDVSEGTFYSGRWHGEASYHWANGDKFQGLLRKGWRHGFGTFTGANGTKMAGDWQKDELHGNATLTWAVLKQENSGERATYGYDGELVEGSLHGRGTLTMPDGAVCNGSFEENKKSGLFEVAWADGSTFSGTFHKDLLDGEGTFHGPPGEDGVVTRTQSENWRRGKLQQRSTCADLSSQSSTKEK